LDLGHVQKSVGLPFLASGADGGLCQGDLLIGLVFGFCCLASQKGCTSAILNKFVESVGLEPVPSIPCRLACRVGFCIQTFFSSSSWFR
jgi:hypothetical protein